MDELKELASQIDDRCDKLERKDTEIKIECAVLDEKGADRTEEESERLAELNKAVDIIDALYYGKVIPNCEFLDCLYHAKEDIEKLDNRELNKSVRTKIIKSLMAELSDAKGKEPEIPYTTKDINDLYNNRANEVEFNKTLTDIDNAVTSSFYAGINEINAILDRLEADIEKLDNKSGRRVDPTNSGDNEEKGKNKNKIIKRVILGVVGIAALAIILHSCNKGKEAEVEDTRQVDEPKQTEFVITTPVATPTPVPTAEPTTEPTPVPTAEPTTVPTAEPTPVPTAEPTPVPTAEPTPVVLDRETDIQNRAIIVANTGFFDGAYPSDVVGVLNAIHDREMWATENAEYAQAFNTTFNRIFDHYMTETLTMDDLNKLEALKDLAKDNSDLDRFLEIYSDLLKCVLTNQKGANTRMRQFIEIFGTSLNGFTNEPNLLTDDDNFNEAAQVNDFFDWWFVYDSIIKPTYPLLYPARLYEIDGAIIENIMYYTYGATEEERRAYIEALGLGEYEEEIYNQIRLLEMQMTMESALTNHPKFCEIRHITEGPELVRGGND